MNCLDSETRSRVVNCSIEGCSIRATVRMTGVAKNTIVKLLAVSGLLAVRTMIVMSEICGSAVCSAMRSGHSSAQKPRMSASRKNRRVGAMYGHGSGSTRIQNSSYRIGSADAGQIGK